MALRDCFDTTDWDVLCEPHGEDIDDLTTCITDYINFCVENIVPTRKVRCFHKNKPWVTPELKALLNEKKRVFKSSDKKELRRGIRSAQIIEELRRVQKELRRGIRSETVSFDTFIEQNIHPFTGLTVSPPSEAVPLDCGELGGPAWHTRRSSKRHEDPKRAQETQKTEAVLLDCRGNTGTDAAPQDCIAPGNRNSPPENRKVPPGHRKLGNMSGPLGHRKLGNRSGPPKPQNTNTRRGKPKLVMGK